MTVNKTFKTATRIAAGSALAFSAFAVTSLPAQAAGTPDTATAVNEPAAGNEFTFGPLVDGGLFNGGLLNGGVVNGPVVDGPLVDLGDTGPFQFGQFQ
ncbi:hypothetical protein DQ354_03005 [Arthrobacter sp. AQ5-06]|nr:hypothetical protein DQ354_03005 [Arthrobacter sp. AQ5-06]